MVSFVKQVLIHWQNKPIEEASWEEELVFKSGFPTFNLEGKTVIDGGGSNKEQAKREEEGKTFLEPKKDQRFWHVYSRKKSGTRGGQRKGQLEMNGAKLVAQKRPSGTQEGEENGNRNVGLVPGL